LGREAQPHRHGLAWVDFEPVVHRGLGALLLGIHCVLLSVDDIVVDGILEVRANFGVGKANPRVIGRVLGKKQRCIAFAVKTVSTKLCLRRGDCTGACGSIYSLE